MNNMKKKLVLFASVSFNTGHHRGVHMRMPCQRPVNFA